MAAKEYYLMHKNIPVCLMEISEDGAISNIRRNAAGIWSRAITASPFNRV